MVLVSDKYKIEKMIHNGLNTQIHLAIKLSDKNPVILKSIKQELFSEGGVQKLKNEFNLLTKLNSPTTIKAVELIENEMKQY